MSLASELTVQSCESGEQALAHLRVHQTDLVLLDVMMPGMDGPATMTRMLADPALKHIPVIFMTAKAMPQEAARFREMGAIGVIPELFDPMQLAQQVVALWKALTGSAR